MIGFATFLHVGKLDIYVNSTRLRVAGNGNKHYPFSIYIYIYIHYIFINLGTLLLMWFNLNPSMDK